MDDDDFHDTPIKITFYSKNIVQIKFKQTRDSKTK